MVDWNELAKNPTVTGAVIGGSVVLVVALITQVAALVLFLLTRSHQLNQDQKRDERALRDERRERLRKCYQTVLSEVWRLRDVAEGQITGNLYPPLGLPANEDEVRTALLVFRAARVQLALENERKVRHRLEQFGGNLLHLLGAPEAPGPFTAMKAQAAQIEEAMIESLEALQLPVK